jgi:hypothetical protein
MHVTKLIHEGVLPVRMVGSYRRIPRADLETFKRQERAKQRAAMDRIHELEREGSPVDDVCPVMPSNPTAAMVHSRPMAVRADVCLSLDSCPLPDAASGDKQPCSCPVNAL